MNLLHITDLEVTGSRNVWQQHAIPNFVKIASAVYKLKRKLELLDSQVVHYISKNVVAPSI